MKVKLLMLVAFLVTSVSMAQCDYTLELTDNFGNEWDSGDNLTANAGVDVTVNGVTTTYLVMNPSTVPNTPVVENYTITVNDGDALSIDYRATFFTGDGGFRFLDSEAIEVYASPLNQASMMSIYSGSATCPTCFAVTQLTTNAITATSADIGWTASGSETAWEVEYGPVGFTPGSGTTDNATSNPWNIDALMSSTAYDVYVRADCGMGDISSNQGPVSFTTTESCPTPGAFAPLPTTATSVPFTWDANGNTSTDFEIEYGPSPYTQGSGGMTITGFTAPFADVTGLISNTSYDFYVRIDCGMGDFSGWSAAYTATTLQSCPDISGITFNNITQTTLDIDWTAGGTETEWEIEYGVAPLNQGTGTLITSTTIPYTLTGLLSGTSYEICITAVCGPMDRSTPVCSTVLTPADYCNGDQLVDSGGATGDYAAGENVTYTVCPDNAGDVVYIDFTQFVLESNATCSWDSLTIYDGPDVNSPTVDPPTGPGTGWCFENGVGTGDLTGMQLIGKLPSGCITFTFVSDGGGQRAGFTADVTCAAPPTCPMPFDLSFDGSTNNAADLSWTAGGIETEWNIEYGVTGFTPGMGTVVNTMANPFSVPGLIQNTTYDFYITGVCGVGDESTQVGPVSGTTQCDAFVAPYSEDFEMGFTPIPVTNNFPGTGDAFSLENCYSAVNTNYFWVMAPGTLTASTNTGPNVSITTGNYIYAEGSNGVAGDIAELSTPLFDSTGLTLPAVGFDYHMAGSGIGALEVVVRAAGVDTVVATLTGTQQAADTDPYVNLNVALNAFVGQTFQIVFKATLGSGFESDIAIDNLTIDEAPLCPAPLGLSIDSEATDNISLSWTNGGSETAWEIEYVASGAAQGTGTIAAAATNPYMVTGLTANTPYDFYVRAVCSPGDESIWIGPIAGRTSCVAFTVPFTEGFNSTSTTQDCWTVLDANGDGDQWTLDYAFNPSEGDEVAAINTDFNGGNDDDYLISPAITLTGVDRLRYEYRVQSVGEPNEMEVLISTTGTAAVDFTTVLLPVTSYSNITYVEEVIDLSAYTGDVYIAWRIPPTTTDGWRMYIDNVRFEVIPGCDEPIMLTATGATTTSIDIAFTERGTATAWEIEYGAPGFVLGTGTLISANTNPFTISGLTENTGYDYYVRSICPAGGNSPWSSAASFRTSCNSFAVPFTETFDSTSMTEACWTVLDVNGDGDQWGLDNATSGGGDQAAAINTDFNGGVDDDYLISPPLTLTGNQRLKYLYRAQSTGEPNDMEVLLSTTGTDAADFTTTLLPLASYGNITYQEEIIDISAFTGDVHIAFRIPPNGTDGWIMYIDEFVVEDIPSCPDPLMVTAQAVQANSVDISWTAEALATTVTIEYGPCGFVPGTMDPNAITVTATSNPFNISALTAGICYEAYVSFDCSGSASILSTPATFNTQCDPIATPYQEGFNTGSTTEDCWSVLDVNGDGDTWDLNYTQNPFEGDQSANINTDFNGGNDDDYLISPSITLTGNQQMRYQYRVQSDFEPNNMEVLLSTTGVSASDFTVTLVPATQYSNTTYVEAIVDLSSYTGTVNVAFRIPPSSIDGWRMYIDDVNFEDRSSCPKPDMLVVDMITPNTANFSWNETGSATLWQVEVQSIGAAQGTAGAIYENLTATNPQLISGLSSETSYDVYLRSDCGMGDFSDWEGPITFTTPCDVFTLPYGNATTPGNDFSTFPGNCWEEGNASTIAAGPNGVNGDWQTDDFANDTASVNGQSAKINIFNNASPNEDWLVTPDFDLGVTTHNYAATFDIALTAFAATGALNFGSDDEVQLLITDDNGVTWNNLTTWNAASNVSNVGQLETVSLSAYSGIVRLAFWASNGVVADTEDYDFFVDNFTIDGTASNDAFARAKLVLYPNPVSNMLYVNSDVSIYELTIYNLMGQKVKSKNVADNPQINVQDLPSGVYLLEINNGENKRSLRFIKE